MEETIKVVEFLALVEQVYDKGVSREKFGQHYQAFKTVVTSISEEKQIDRQFQALSSYSIYQAVKLWKAKQAQYIKIG